MGMRRFEIQVGEYKENVVVFESDNNKDFADKLGFFIHKRGLSVDDDVIRILKVEDI